MPVETPTAPITWAERLNRVFAIDVLACPRCGGGLCIIAGVPPSDVTDPGVIQKILNHMAERRLEECAVEKSLAKRGRYPGRPAARVNSGVSQAPGVL